MIKSSKLSHKSHKASKDSSMRKSHLSKKSMRSRSPMGLSGSSRSSSMKHISPGLKRGHPMSKRKTSRSPRLHSGASPHRSLSHRSKQESPVSMERARSMKSAKYDKRKHLSNSPVRHLKPNFTQGPMIQLDARDFSPYPAERYPSAEALSPQYVSPTRKKVRREAERYFSSQSMSASPPRRHPAAAVHPEGHISHRAENISPVLHHKHRRTAPSAHGEREKHSYDARHKHMSPPILHSGNSKEASGKIPYSNESSSRYRSSAHGERYPTGGQKSYGPTLHERFSTVIETSRHEPRIQYSREDLEKITIDIRNLREPSPTLRHIPNPSDVKLVRRANEGHRPIFDREEIKQAPRDMREDAYYERKKTTNSYSSAHGIDLREVENYQITRHRLDTHNLFSSSSGRTLNERWQNPEARKESISLDRDERERDKQYDRVQPSRNYAVARSRSRSGDRDFRSERYLDAKPVHGRSEYPRPPPDIAEPRSSAPYAHRKSSIPVDARHKLSVRKSDRGSHSSSMRSEPKGSFHPHSDRHYSEAMPSRIERRDHHSPIPEPTKWSYKSRSPSREKLEYSRRLEKIGYDRSWSDRPNVSNRSSYSEHESRDGPSSYYARGGSRPFRSSQGFRGFRGPLRGSSFRGSFRGFRGSMNMRGRGTFRR